MTVFTKPGSDVFSPVNADGTPRSIVNQDAQVWSTEVERIVDAFVSGGGTVIQTAAVLPTLLNYPPLTMAWVVNDPDPNLNGIYQKQGVSGTGSWVRLLDLPYSFITATNVGAGTANAIVATSSIPVPTADGGALVTVNVTDRNTGPATISFNGGPALPIKTSGGNEVVTDGLQVGMILAGYVSGGAFRLLSDQTSSAIQVAAEAAALHAKEWANNPADEPVSVPAGGDDATTFSARHWATKALDAAASTTGSADYSSRTVLKAVEPTAPGEVAYLSEEGREGKFRWRVGDYSAQIAGDPLEGLYIESSVAGFDRTVGAWVRVIKHGFVDPDWWGAVPDAVRYDRCAITAGSNVVGAIGASFTSADVGKSLFLQRGGAIGPDTRAMHLSSTITQAPNATQVRIATAASTDVINLKGCVGTDSTDAWKAAVTSGYPIRVKPGHKYLVTDKLGPLTKSIFGQGDGCAIYASYADNDVVDGSESVFYVNGADDISVRKLTGEWFGYFKKSYIAFVYVQAGHNFKAQEVEASGFSTSGIRLGSGGDPAGVYTTKRPLVENCYLHHNRAAGLFFGNTEDLKAIACRFEFNGLLGDGGTGYGSAGLQGTFPKNTLIMGCHANDNYRKGIDFHAGVGVSIIGNYCFRNKIEGIYVEDWRITGNVIIKGNSIGEMIWNGTIASGVPGEGSAPAMYGILIGSRGDGAPYDQASTNAPPTSYLVEGNIITDFTMTAEQAFPIYFYGVGLRQGAIKIRSNIIRVGSVTSIVNSINSGALTDGDWYDVDISGNTFEADNVTSSPFSIRGLKNRKKIFSDNTVTIRSLAVTSGLFVYDTPNAAGHTITVSGNTVEAPESGWSTTFDWVAIRRTASEQMYGNTVNGAKWREFDGVRFHHSGAGVRPVSNYWPVGAVWDQSDAVAGTAPGSYCTTAGGAVWAAWSAGMGVGVGTWLSNNGRAYRCMVRGPGTTANAPTHTSGSATGADGYTWLHMATLAVFKPLAPMAA